MPSSQEIMRSWPQESREAAQTVVKTYGEPDEFDVTEVTFDPNRDPHDDPGPDPHIRHDRF